MAPVLPPGCNRACNACHHRTFSAEESLRQKHQWILRQFRDSEDIVSPVISPDAVFRLGYRDKVCLAARWTSDGWLLGTRRDDEVVPIHDCPVHTPRVTRMISILRPVVPDAGKFPMAYYVQSGAQVTFVLKTASVPDMTWFSDDVARRIGEAGVEGIWLHLHPSAGHRVFLKRDWKLAWGREFSVDPGGFAYGPVSFQQLIPGMHDLALRKASEWLGAGNNSMVIDLCCGTGKSLRIWQDAGAAVMAVELSGEAVRYANINVPGATVLRGKNSERIPQLDGFVKKEGRGKERLLYVNPPRTGLEPTVTEWIAATYLPERIAYQSCNAVTLAKDLSVLSKAGYRAISVIPFDFFPQTRHVEVLALIGRGLSSVSEA